MGDKLGAAVVAKQVLVGVVAVMGAVCSGGSLAYSAVALPQLQGDLDQLDADQASWFASLSSMCTPVGCVLVGLLLDRLGRRALLLMLDVPFVAGWLLLALCPAPAHDHAVQLYAGRLLTGLATGLASVPATVYLGETAPPRLRSTFVTWTSLSISAGILLAYALGAVLPWRAAAGVWAALPGGALALTWLLLPESPAWLARRGRAREAEAALRRLRAQPQAGPLSPAVAAELALLQALDPKNTAAHDLPPSGSGKGGINEQEVTTASTTTPSKFVVEAKDRSCNLSNSPAGEFKENQCDCEQKNGDIEHCKQNLDPSDQLDVTACTSISCAHMAHHSKFGHSNPAFEEEAVASPVVVQGMDTPVCVVCQDENANLQTAHCTGHKSEEKLILSSDSKDTKGKQSAANLSVSDIQSISHRKSYYSTPQEESRVADEVCETALSSKLTTALKRTWILLCNPAVWRPLLLLNLYFIFMQLAGVYVVVSYAVDIVTDAGVVIDAYMATIMLGGVQLVSSLVVSYIVTRCGRRPLSIISGAGMMLCMLGLSIYLQLADLSSTNESAITLLPLILLILYVVFGALGFHTLPWALLGEVFPAHARGPAAGATTCLAYLTNFAALKLYPSLANALTTDRGDGEWTSRDVFLFFAATSLAGTIFVTLLLPETFKRSLQEIEYNFQHGNILQVCASTPKKENEEIFKEV